MKRNQLIPVALCILLMLLALGWARKWLFTPKESGTKLECKSNLRTIAVALEAYADAHGGVFPCKFSVVAINVKGGARRFACPSAMRPVGSIETVDRWSDYVLVPGVSRKDGYARPLAYCRPADHDGEGTNVLFVDGHVEWYDMLQFEAALREWQPVGKMNIEKP